MLEEAHSDSFNLPPCNPQLSHAEQLALFLSPSFSNCFFFLTRFKKSASFPSLSVLASKAQPLSFSAVPASFQLSFFSFFLFIFSLSPPSSSCPADLVIEPVALREDQAGAGPQRHSVGGMVKELHGDVIAHAKTRPDHHNVQLPQRRQQLQHLTVPTSLLSSPSSSSAAAAPTSEEENNKKGIEKK